ncbi:hypothetical protein CONLIGDRAFT_678062 [Coniochaeta ligniaria NRRL 30616]|uniref:BRCT domain-containing protein n=1 Tax=Coniochaeta ligniaria NRRL 30616 TaxID=1408157 RepID=A0A1J7JNW7_9PEZI|nr:hypothetical protein CONLIGDRAFT_678062 [Coniochaeta ligniaria NRRL 30616]
MAPPKPPVPRAADANLSRVFDPWNSVGSGHQRPETKGPGGWRESRAMKMNSQLVAGNSGGERIHDTVGEGSLDFDDKRKVFIPKEVRARAMCSVVDMLRRQGSGAASEKDSSSLAGSRSLSAGSAGPRNSVSPVKTEQGGKEESILSNGTAAVIEDTQMDDRRPDEEEPQPRKRKIFDNLVIYVNGSTHPIISDYKLKHLLAENGARMSFHLGRRQVTHVILGRPASVGHGAGGGLAGGKLEKEIRSVGGCGIKYVGVEWVLESIKAGKRLPEARFANLKVAPRGQQSVYGAFAGAKSAVSASSQRQLPHS